MLRDQLNKENVRYKKLKHVKKVRAEIQGDQQQAMKEGRKRKRDMDKTRREMEKDKSATVYYDEVDIVNGKKEKEFTVKTLMQIRDERPDKRQKKTVSVAYEFRSNDLHDIGEFEPRK